MNLLTKIYPYIKILRLGDNNPPLVLFLFGVLDAGYLNFWNVALICLALFLISSGVYVTNEIIDSKDTDKFSQRNKILRQSQINLKMATAMWFFLNAVAAVILIHFQLYWQAAAVIILGNFYSLPPFRFKAKFPYDIFSIFIFYMVIPYSIGFSLMNLPFSQMIGIPFITVAITLGTAEAIHFLVDIRSDEKAALHNTAVVLGRNNLIRVCKIFLTTSALGLLYLVYKHSNWWYWPLILTIPYTGYAVGRLREVVYHPKGFDKVLNTAYVRGIKIGNFLVLYLLAILYYLYLTSR